MPLYPPPIEPIESHAHVERSEYIRHGCTVQTVNVKTQAAAQSLEREMGEYITIKTGPLYQLEAALNTGNCLAEVLEAVFTPFFQDKLCICGLGNPDSICDSVGPATIKLLPAMFLEYSDAFHEGRFSKLATFIPGVQETTNLDTEDLVAALVSVSDADCLVLIDAIAVEGREHLCNNILITTDSTSRHAGGRVVDWYKTGVPIIHIGVPTMVQDSSPTAEADDILTVYQIQDVIATAAALIAYALVRVSYPALSEHECVEAIRLRQMAPLDW